MINQYLTLRALAAEWNTLLAGMTVAGIWSQTKNELILSFDPPASGGPSASLQVSVDPRLTYAVLRPKASRARRNSVDLFSSLRELALIRCFIHPSDRTITCEFHGGVTLQLLLYGSAENNVILIDGERRVTEAFKRNRDVKGTIAAEMPDSTLVLYDGEAFRNHFGEQPGKPPAALLRGRVRILGPLYAAEIVHRAGLEAVTRTGDLDAAAIERLRTGTIALLEEALHPEAGLYRVAAGDPVLSVIRLRQPGADLLRSFPSVNDAAVAVRGGIFRSAPEGMKDALLRELAEKRERHERAAGNAAKHVPEDPDMLERFGNLLLTNLDDVKKGMAEISLPDLLRGGEIVRIGLDPLLTPARNAERYFERARKGRRDARESRRRAGELQDAITGIRELEALVAHCGTDEELTSCIDAHEAAFAAAGITREKAEKEKPPFRIFTVAGNYEVWVGKNSANNDMLTVKYARPDDIWMHARGAGGSHTVLRVRGRGDRPPREAIEQAAAIAAYYSKMRNAKHVPVAYCERKYVRKVRHTPEGTVYLDREEIVFVTPRLP